MLRYLKWNWMFLALVLCCAFALPTFAQTANRKLEVLDLKPVPSASAIWQARKAFQSGQVIRAVGSTPEQLRKVLGIPIFRGGATASSSDGNLGVSDPVALVLRAVAVRRTERGEVRQLLSYGPADDPTPEKTWKRGMERWLEKEAAGTSEAQAPSPPAEAWTLLNSVTLQATSSFGNFSQVTGAFYRLIETDTNTDWYMVLTNPEVTPNYNGCNGYDYCSWHTTFRNFTIGPLSSAATLVDHGPTSTITSESAGFSIGGTLTPAGPGVSATFSQSWTQLSVTTVDQTSSTEGVWAETFNYEIPNNCNPSQFVPMPQTGTGTFVSYQGAIFSVPAASATVTIPIRTNASFCQYNGQVVPILLQNDSITLAAAIETGPPVLVAFPAQLSIPPGGSATLRVSALIPNSPQGFPWTVASNQQWLAVPANGPFSVSRDLTISVAPGTAVGTMGAISVDSFPPFAAPSVETGPIVVPVVVGSSGPPLLPPVGVLLTGGISIDGTVVKTADVYDLTSGQIIPVGDMAVPRIGHTVTRLQDGTVLVVGGTGSSPLTPPFPVTASSEIYSPATSQFSAVGNLLTARSGHTATLLPDGKVLIVGGNDLNGEPVARAEVYDPSTRSFTATGSLETPRLGAGATGLDGQNRVLVYGGVASSILASAELWDAATGTFSPSSPMVSPQAFFPEAAEVDFNYSIVGGTVEGSMASRTEQSFTVYDLKFGISGALNAPRSGHTLTALADKLSLLVTGGTTANLVLNLAELRNESGWTVVPSVMTSARVSHTATLLPDGRVFIAGGQDNLENSLSSTEFFDPATGGFSVGPSMPARSNHEAIAFSLVNVPTTIALTSDANPAPLGREVTFIATLNQNTATGTVTFKDGATVLGSPIPLTNGQATYRTATLAGGSHAITAVYSGDSTFAPSTSAVVTQVITLQNTSTALSVSPDPSQLGQTVSLLATVNRSSGGAPTGSVQFFDGTTPIATVPLQGNTATVSTANLTLGTHTLTAQYLGSADYAPSTSAPVALPVQPVRAETKTILSSSQNPAAFGQPVVLRATISTNTTSSPTGNVSFYSGTALLGTGPLVSGTASLSVSNFNVGVASLTAAYAGDSGYTASTSPVLAQTINPAATVTTLGSSLNPSQAGQEVTFIVTVSGPTGIAPPTGSVQFLDGGAVLGTASLSGTVATFKTSALAVGPHSITATYLGADGYATSTSNTVLQTVTAVPVATATSLVSSRNPSAFGQSVTFSATVSASGGSGTPTGTVTFFDGQSSIGSGSLVNGTTALTTATLAAGPHTITAQYAGSPGYTASLSTPLTQVVDLVATATALTAAPNPSRPGQTVTLSVTVTAPSGGIPAGTVRFFDGTTLLGTATLQGNTATFTTSTLAVGVHPLSAQYLGNGNFAPSTSAVVNQKVSQPVRQATTTNLVSDNNPSESGELVTFTATVSASGGATPGGSVTFSNGSRRLGTAVLRNGQASLSTDGLSEAFNQIQAAYSGSGTYAPSSGELTQEVSP